MFPLSSDGVFEDPLILFEQDKFLEDLLANCPSSDDSGKISNSTGKVVKKRPKKVPSSKELQGNNQGGSDSKKNAHRFTEKQRRQEMSTLYALLRSLLPLEYVKGKRAISDHMDQAVNYINDMKKKIEEMQKRREELWKVCNAASTSSVVDAEDSNNNVRINLLRDGMEILIISSLNKESFPLSKVLANLLHRELNVINSVSTRGASCYLHKIHIERNASTTIDLSELQEQMENLIRFV